MIPVEKNKTYKVKITAMSSDGNGIAKIDGYTIFVPYSVPGDELEVLIVKVNSSHSFAKIQSIIVSSPNRTTPKCEAFFKCGGCNMQHLKYSCQLQIKEQFVNDAIGRIGGFKDFKLNGILGAEQPFSYRNKMVFPFGKDKNNETVYGFYRAKSHDIVPLTSCSLGDCVNSQILKTIKTHMDTYNIQPYDEKTHSGLVRRVFTRKSYHTEELMVVISVNGDKLPESEPLIKQLLSDNSKISSIILNINKNRNNLVLGDKNIVLFGKSSIHDLLCGFDYEISPNSFFQINPQQTEKLYKTAIEYADIKKDDTVMDIYCGIGTISLCAAKYAKKVIGIEIVDAAIEDAKENAKRNNIKNAEFYASDAQTLVPKLIKNGTSPDIIILDPPRKGSDPETLSAAASSKPRKIVYVSCNPATLARDIKYLSTLGYFPEAGTAVDMFPNTSHVETVVLLCRKTPMMS